MYSISYESKFLILLFVIIYSYNLFFKVRDGDLDLYDYIMLSSIAVFPAFFAISPNLIQVITNLVGVKFPFVLLFAILFAILFIFVHRMTVKIHRLESINRRLIQELSLLKCMNL